MLWVRRPGSATSATAWSSYLVVAQGKHGARDELSKFDGSWVELRGSLIHRGGDTMIEWNADEPRSLANLSGAPPGVTALGTQTLVGEIVDSKCFLGVMAPGDTKAHRACATRCIAGGIPPLLLVRDAIGRAFYILLTAEDGTALNDAVLPFVAEPVEITGQLSRRGERLILGVDPSNIRRLAG
jgi:hypothetical protein